MMDLPRPRPARVTLEGRYVRLEPVSAVHGEGLFRASSGDGAEARFAHLFDDPPADLAQMQAWIARAAATEDPLFFAVIDRATGEASGRQALMRVTPEHGVIEIGHILWGPAIARTRVATEAFFLAARYAFDDLGYRRFEWKCNDRNEPSKSAARRFGCTFEGVFRQHMWAKGANRDTAWFSIVDREWSAIRDALEHWLEPSNFDAKGQQRSRLQAACGINC
jgi:RimJ/RimL family protein N-acetyltransferase